MWWHVFGRIDDESSLVMIAGPTPLGPDEIEERKLVVPELAYLGTQDHKVTDAEKDEYVEMMEAHA